MQHIDFGIATGTDVIKQEPCRHNECQSITPDLQSLPVQLRLVWRSTGKIALGIITYQTARITDRIHDVVAGVDTESAGDTLILETVTNIDTGRANLNTETAVYAVAMALGLTLFACLQTGFRQCPASSAFTALGIITDG